LAAQTRLSVPPLELPALERWISTSLELPVEPGHTEAWAAATRETLLSEPSLPLEEALARSFAKVHKLPAERAEQVRSALAGRAVDSLPGREVARLKRNRQGLYSLSDRGLDHFDGKKWTNVDPDIREGYGLYGDDDVLYVGDGKRIYEVKGVEAEPIQATFGVRHFGSFFRHEGTAYLGNGGFMGGGAGLFENRGEGWVVSPGSEILGSAGRVQEHEGKLYIGARNGVFRKDKEGWTPVLTGQGDAHWLIEHDGKLYARTWGKVDDKDILRVFSIEGGVPKLLFPESDYVVQIDNAGGNLIALVSGKLHQLLPSGWVPVLEDAGAIRHSTIGHGDAAYIQAENGIYKGVGGVWTRVFDRSPWIGQIFEHLGTKWMTTGMGLARVLPDRIEIEHPGLVPTGIESHGRDLYVGTDTGVKRLLFGPEELPENWRDRFLSWIVQASFPEPVAPQDLFAGNAETIHRGGRTVFSRLAREGK
jgi:hypothetical protein